MSVENYTLKTGDLSTEQSSDNAFSPVIIDLYNALNEQLMQLFSEMITSATCNLMQLDSEKFDYTSAEADAKGAKERESIRFLVRENNNIKSQFLMHVNDQLKPATEHVDNNEIEELSLVDHQEMEEMVAITTMHSNAMNLYGEAISHLQARVEYLEIMSAPISSESLAPKKICEAFQTTLKNLDLGTDCNLHLFRLFNDEINIKLGDMYDSLNKILIDANIMPTITHNSHEHEVDEEENITTRTANYYDTQEKVETNFIPRSQEDLSDIVSQFMNGDIDVSSDNLELPASFYKAPTQKNIDGKKYYQRKEVVNSLSKLQKKLTESGNISKLNNIEEIKETILEDINSTSEDGTTREVTVLDERSMDFVGMLFNAITADDSNSEVITELLMQLQIPVIKVAMNDEKLFTDEEHPARNVLNLIPKAGQGVTDKSDKTYGDLDQIVQKILQEYDVDITSFNKAVKALQEVIRVAEESASITEKEEKRAIIKQHARKVVVNELRVITANKRLPKSIQPLFLKHWSTLMLNRYIKYGNESPEWQQSIQLAELIVELVQPLTEMKKWDTLVNNYESLLDTVYAELHETQQDKISIDEQIDNLESILLALLDEKDNITQTDDNELDNVTVLNQISSTDAETTSSENIDPDDELEQYLDVIRDYHTAKQEAAKKLDQEVIKIKADSHIAMDKVSSLPTYTKPGAWFEIYNGEDHIVRRLKLSVILIETATLVFVDSKGVKVIEKDAGVFAEELNSNKSHLLSDHCTFDNALGKVIASMAA